MKCKWCHKLSCACPHPVFWTSNRLRCRYFDLTESEPFGQSQCLAANISTGNAFLSSFLLSRTISAVTHAGFFLLTFRRDLILRSEPFWLMLMATNISHSLCESLYRTCALVSTCLHSISNVPNTEAIQRLFHWFHFSPSQNSHKTNLSLSE